MEVYIPYLYIASAVIVLLLAIWLFTIELRMKKLFRGKNASDMEGVISSLGEGLRKMEVSHSEMEKYLEEVEGRLRKSVQKVNTVRFNPFEDSGSNQSFAVSFLDENGDGAVISSLYSREGVRIYAKPIKDSKSEYRLSDEEKEAIGTDRVS